MLHHKKNTEPAAEALRSESKSDPKQKNTVSRVFHNGAYASILTVLAIAIAIVLGLIVDALPSKYTEFDLSAAGALTLGDTTKEILSGLDSDVTAYYLVQSGQEDSLVKKLLTRYAETSSHFKWQQVDPTVKPNFAKEHDAESATQGSVILSSGDENHLISFTDLYPDYASYAQGYADSYSFDGENAITTAIYQVTSGESSMAYYTTNHGETALSSDLLSSLKSQNIKTDALSLLTSDVIPDDCDLLIVNCPQSDFTGAEGTNEIALLKDYLAGGGKLLLFTDAQYPTPNLDGVMAEYGLSRVAGVVLESDSNNYLPDTYASNYLNLTGMMCPLPTLNTTGESGIADGLSSGSTAFLAPLPQGIAIASDLPSHIVAESLLTTSQDSYSKAAGYEMKTTAKEDGDTDGPLNLAVWANDSDSGAEVVWCGCGFFTDSTVNTIVNGGNSKLVLACAAQMTDQNSGTLVAAKSLEGDTLTVSAGNVLVWAFVFLAVIPLGLIVFGVVVTILRRRK
ncbi:MAG: GldG family protein [Faecalibacterium sp.]|jgi:ABC-2 type transport system permease protein|nr:GldG family protein [Faecalibacterium sp.]